MLKSHYGLSSIFVPEVAVKAKTGKVLTLQSLQSGINLDLGV